MNFTGWGSEGVKTPLNMEKGGGKEKGAGQTASSMRLPSECWHGIGMGRVMRNILQDYY